MKNIFLALLISATLFSCVPDEKLRITEETEEQWELKAHIHGQKDENRSEAFELNGREVVLKYHMHGHGDHGPNSVKVYLIKGLEEVIDNPVLTMFNKEMEGQQELLHVEPDQYYIQIQAVHAEYDIEIFEKKEE